MASKIENVIYDFISTHFGVERETLGVETTFKEDLDADSLDMVEFTIRVEEEFGITISDEDALGVATLGDAFALIDRYKSESEKPA